MNVALIKAELVRRGLSKSVDLPASMASWDEGMLLTALAAHLSTPNAGHLREDLSTLGIQGRFRCGGSEWMVTDIGIRSLSAIKIDEKTKDDPTWLRGPSYALAETVFDTFDIEGIEID
ncbi:hypothetical protein [Rhizobium sp. BK176]|uniref:hypothetical protein n=1 Tax=Rhizobium sp. BK176 TaxID=2587071 RepID=UPI0021696EE3|nr:hypothetical protein [Rhizobium sp. BK176]MCS4088583.1 hypothetical protein [Rhizobium sp. BK176]